uniref:Uncharacterized protein n=1 Tax=Arundo donax TaxID=35708 RepID=A0A0A9BWQ2_ARUDO
MSKSMVLDRLVHAGIQYKRKCKNAVVHRNHKSENRAGNRDSASTNRRIYE